MRTRAAIHREFVERFHVGKRHGPVSDSQLDVIEAELITKFPTAYRDFMTRVARTPKAVSQRFLKLSLWLSRREAVAHLAIMTDQRPGAGDFAQLARAWSRAVEAEVACH